MNFMLCMFITMKNLLREVSKEWTGGSLRPSSSLRTQAQECLVRMHSQHAENREAWLGKGCMDVPSLHVLLTPICSSRTDMRLCTFSCSHLPAVFTHSRYLSEKPDNFAKGETGRVLLSFAKSRPHTSQQRPVGLLSLPCHVEKQRLEPSQANYQSLGIR